jgi:hypothetical protein
MGGAGVFTTALAVAKIEILELALYLKSNGTAKT